MLTKEELDQINRFSKAELTADQVYTFSVRLCDNEVDRDFERFGTEDLDRLGELFLGKSGIFDHQWSANVQTARIYRTEVVREPGTVTAAGDEYRWLKGWAYLMRTEKNQELITEIEGGIKKEVSVGCSMGRSVCSVCGASQEDPLLAVLCEAAEAAWESRLDPGVTKEDCGGALRCAAAFMAAILSAVTLSTRPSRAATTREITVKVPATLRINLPEIFITSPPPSFLSWAHHR